MRILLSNDDGYTAPGINILADYLKKEGHEVYIVAPDRNRSAVSNSVSFFDKIVVNKISDKVYSCSGTPADCVMTGLQGNILDVQFDAVIGGINCGSNLGTDIVYSGTCAVARQAVVNNCPSLSVSLDPIDWDDAHKNGFHYEPLSEFVAKNIEKLISFSNADNNRCFVNINGRNITKYKGVKFTQNFIRRHDEEKLVYSIDEKGNAANPKVIFRGDKPDRDKDSDSQLVEDGFITISTVKVDPCGDIPEGADENGFVL